MRVISRVVIRAGRDNGSVDVRSSRGANLGHYSASERAVEVESEAEIEIREVITLCIHESGNHVARQAHLLVAGRVQEVTLAAFLSNQDIRVRDICTARQVETDERNLAGTVRDVAFSGGTQAVQVLR